MRGWACSSRARRADSRGREGRAHLLRRRRRCTRKQPAEAPTAEGGRGAGDDEACSAVGRRRACLQKGEGLGGEGEGWGQVRPARRGPQGAAASQRRKGGVGGGAVCVFLRGAEEGGRGAQESLIQPFSATRFGRGYATRTKRRVGHHGTAKPPV